MPPTDPTPPREGAHDATTAATLVTRLQERLNYWGTFGGDDPIAVEQADLFDVLALARRWLDMRERSDRRMRSRRLWPGDDREGDGDYYVGVRPVVDADGNELVGDGADRE